jgi:hypothetical protein
MYIQYFIHKQAIMIADTNIIDVMDVVSKCDCVLVLTTLLPTVDGE